MTEGEWLECTDPTPMLEFLRERASERKLRLFSCACCRTVWDMLADERSRRGLEAAECHADNPGHLAEDDEVLERCFEAMADASGDSESAEFGHTKWHAATTSAHCILLPFRWLDALDASRETRQAESCYLFETVHNGVAVPFPEPEISDGSAHSALIRCIFGNPFCPITINPIWLTPPVASLAQSAYDERIMPLGELDSDRFAVLSDALEEAGCDDTAILNHLRSPGPHVRGCWAVDLLTGRS